MSNQPQPQSNAMLTLDQVAEIEHIHINTARMKARCGKIPGALRKGRSWLITAAKYEKHCGYAPGTMPIPDRKPVVRRKKEVAASSN